MSRTRRVPTSKNKDDWPECEKCGKKSATIFVDNGLCPSCDRERSDKNE